MKEQSKITEVGIWQKGDWEVLTGLDLFIKRGKRYWLIIDWAKGLVECRKMSWRESFKEWLKEESNRQNRIARLIKRVLCRKAMNEEIKKLDE